MENMNGSHWSGREKTKFAQTALTMLTALAASVSIYFISAPNQVSAAPSPASANLVAGDSAERFAWMLFVQSVRPSGNAHTPLTFENWKEQCDIQPLLCGISGASATASANGSNKDTGKIKVRHAHGSALAKRLMKATSALNAPSISCSPMNTAGFPPEAPATNVAPNAVFCEEVFVNAAESTFITNNKLTTIDAQQAFGNITFPWDAVEIKVDWVPQSSFTTPFSCPSKTVYTEMIQFEGNAKPVCYALVGMHISSKVLPDWLWATFEPNDTLTNPNRCNGNLYDLCSDSWGTTSPNPYGPGQTPQQSAALSSLMKSANLPAVFNNYFLTGVQTQHVQNGQPTQLGNSFVEFNAGVEPHQASCITCHNYAYAGTTTIGTPLPGWPNVGYACNKPGATASCVTSYPGASGWTSEDFSWLLGIMPTGSKGAKAVPSHHRDAATKAPAKP